MARQEIDLTTPQPGGKMGEPTKAAWEKVNDMTLELYAQVENKYGVPFAEVLATKRIALIAGTMRQSTTNLSQWNWISDSGHVPVGLSTITASGDTLTVSFDKEYGRVISLVASPDETLAQMGFSVGASVNLDNFALRASISREVAGHVRYLGGGVWEHKILSSGGTVDGPTPSFSGTTLTVTHDVVPGGSYNHPAVTPWSNNADYIPRIPCLRSSSTVNFNVQFFSQALDAFIAQADLTNRASLAYRKGYSGPVNFDGTGTGANLNLFNGNIWVLGCMELVDP